MWLLFAVTQKVFSNYYLCLKMVVELVAVTSETMCAQTQAGKATLQRFFRDCWSPHCLSLAGFSFYVLSGPLLKRPPASPTTIPFLLQYKSAILFFFLGFSDILFGFNVTLTCSVISSWLLIYILSIYIRVSVKEANCWNV